MADVMLCTTRKRAEKALATETKLRKEAGLGGELAIVERTRYGSRGEPFTSYDVVLTEGR